MRNATIFLLAAAALAAPAALATQTAATARLHVLRERPAVVRGDRFKAGERVTVVLIASERWVRTATAGDQGVVTVRFAVALPDCGRYTLQAFGSKGSRARSLARRDVCSNPAG